MDIAIIGVAGRFPEAKTIEELYLNLKRGRDSARHLSEKRLKDTAFSTQHKYSVFSWLDDIDKFDYRFFDISLAEAQNMDPHQRILLEVVYEMFESSGYNIDDFNGSNTAIFSGDVTLKYYELAQKFDPTLLTGNTNAATAGRIARNFNLRGSALMVDTNCSSTLVATDLACKEIMLGEADHAIVCGARLIIRPEKDRGGDDLGIMANDGKTRAFAEGANGTGAGEAVAAILLKPLDKARQDNDLIYGVIKGTALNQEAQLSGSLTAPSSAAQAQVIQKAWLKAGIDPESISYIEPHGTGTKLGDPIEIQGIDLAYKGKTDRKHFVAVSSLKSNIGHTDTVAGLSGMIKSLISLNQKELFGSLHFDTPNPFIDFENSVTYINTSTKRWEKQDGAPLRAGVSSWGISGTNAHIILEEPPAQKEGTDSGTYLITVSGKSASALTRNIGKLKEHLIDNPELSLADVSHTLNRGRKHYEFRFSTVAENIFELIGELQMAEEVNFKNSPELKKLFFIFSDETIPNADTIRSYKSDPVFKQYYEDGLLHAGSKSETDQVQTFAFQYAMYQCLSDKGIKTKNVLGIGIGRAVLDAVVGQKSIEEGIEEALKCEKTEISELQKRLNGLIDRETGKEKVAFIEIGSGSTLIDGLVNLTSDKNEVAYVAVKNTGWKELVSRLYQAGFNLNWKSVHPEKEGKKIKLPSYQFEPIHCWIRETREDNNYPEERSYRSFEDPEPESLVTSLPEPAVNPDWTRTQQTIARFWLEVLKLDSVELHDDFFKLGGHSLLATQLIARIEKKYGFRLEFKNVAVFSTIEKLSAAVEERLAEEGSGTANPIPTAPKADGYPLSHAQKRLWVIDQLEEGGTSYNLPGALILKGKINPDRINSALLLLIQRHESLRTSFHLTQISTVQRIHDSVEFKLIQSECREQELKAKINGFIRPFDLATAPLFRAELSRFGTDQYLLMFDIHHIISDGVSQDILMNDFMAIYAGQSLPHLDVQYKDYAVWQNELYHSGQMQQQEDYWINRFSDDPPVLNLPYDFPRPKVQSYKGAKAYHTLGKDLTGKLKNKAQEMGATPYMLLLAIYNVLLSKYSASEDITVGSPIAGRSHADLEPILGMFVNTLVMRNYPGGNRTFTEFLEEVKYNAGEAYSNQDYPFESLVDKLDLRRDLSRNPLFDTMFSYQSFYKKEKGNDQKQGGLVIEPFPFVANTSKFDITLEVFEGEGTFNLNAEYCTDLFEEETLQTLLRKFESIAGQIVQNPKIRLAEIDVLDEHERNELLVSFNRTEKNYGIHGSFISAFESSAFQFGDNPALYYEGKTLTYAQLNEQANKIANTLTGVGIGTGDVVGIVAAPSVEMITGTLGIMKTGAAYMPIDPKYPTSRVEDMLRLAKVQVMLDQVGLNQSELNFKGTIFSLKESARGVFSSQTSNPDVDVNLKDRAYVIFTSGSTGTPKGIEVSNSALLNMCHWHNEVNALTEDDRCSKYAGFGFDASVLEIFPPLMVGATLFIIPEGLRLDVAAINDFMNQHQITLAFLPTQVCEQFQKLNNKSLRTVITGGDKLSAFQKNTYLLRNYYGPAENTVVSTSFLIDRFYPSIPIGKPIANNKAFVLDSCLQLVPKGVAGELFVTGNSMADGYLNNPEWTAERFVPNPFTREERMYRTGDLVRWNKEGNLEFLGRVDEQVKIRGNRVELGEIQSALLEIEGINKAVVTVHSGNDGNKFLVAYLVSEAKPKLQNIKSVLSDKLPGYMIPSVLQYLDDIPLTPNGKVDKKRLPRPLLDQQSTSEFVAPVTGTEISIAEIWKSVLGIEKVGLTDSFFEIGGHSLNATILLGEIHKQLGIHSTLRQFFQGPTIKDLLSLNKSDSEFKYQKINPVPHADKYPVSAAQRRIFILEQLTPDTVTYNIPGVVKIVGKVDKERLDGAMQKLVARHDALRTRFESQEEEIFQIIDEEIDFNVQYFSVKEEEIKGLISAFIRPYELSEAPLCRVALASISENEHVLMFDIHHIICDGTSLQIIIPELAALYSDFDLEPLNVQYKEYAHWQHELATSEEFKRQRDFWVNYISSHPPVLDLPTDFSRPEIIQPVGKSTMYVLEKEHSEALEKLAKKQGVTEYMVFLAVLNVLLSKYSGQEDLLIGTPTAGRHHPDLQRVVGMFVNTLVIRNAPESEKPFLTFLQEVKENALNVFENQDYQFDELIEELNLERDTSRNPIFDVMYTFQNIEEGSVSGTELAEWKIEPYSFDSSVSKFDLTFDISKRSGSFGIGLEYCTALFKDQTIQNLLEKFELVVAQIVSNPELRIGEIQLLDEKEKNRIVHEFNATETDFSKFGKAPVHVLFEKTAHRFPEREALSFGGNKLSYSELNQRANQVAHYLIGKGNAMCPVVGIMARPSIEMVVGIMGIVKAGVPFVCIDPLYPAERVRYMLEKSEAKILLSELPNCQVEGYSGEIIGFSDLPSSGNTGNPQQNRALTDTAYVIFTSGSTGNPKGIEVPHSALLNLCCWQIGNTDMQFSDRTSKYAGFGFDASIIEIFPPLLVGASLHIVPEEIRLDIEALNAFYNEKEITIAFLPTQVLEQFQFYDNQSLRIVFIGGDKLNIFNKCNYQLQNHYGPAENTVATTAFNVNFHENNIPIGKPIANNKVFLVDKNNNLVPVGVPGELCVAGESLAKGYLNDPDLTNRVFVDCPFIKGKRMYKTGDLARWRSDGNLVFMGRIDDQVKIRGIRIETGEIRARLNRCEHILDAAVTVHTGNDGNKFLAAYVVSDDPNEDYTLDFQEVKQVLKTSLPEYMIPSYFVQVASIPLTANGKLDKKALPIPDLLNAPEKEYIAPESDLEKALASIWMETLNIENIGVTDNFFEIGGHSLNANGIIARIHKNLNIKLPLIEIFRNPTIRTQVELIRQTEMSTYKDIQPVEDRQYYPLSAAQKRIFVLSKIQSESVQYNMPMAFEMEGLLDHKKLEDTFRKLIQRHDSLRTGFELENGLPVQKVHQNVSFDMELIAVDPEEVDDLIAASVQPFDLANAPLLRVKLFRLQETKHILFLDMYHIINDGVSTEILTKEFLILHNGGQLEPLRLQYKDFAVWQEELFKSEEIKVQEKYWLDQFSGEIPVINLPLDYPRPAVQGYKGASEGIFVPQEVVGKINVLSKQLDSTNYMVMLAAYTILLAKYCRQEDLIIGTPIAGRPHADLQSLIGMFVNTLALRNYPVAGKKASDFIKEVTQNALQAFDKQDYPFEELIEKLEVERLANRNPLFDTMFSFINQQTEQDAAGDLVMKPYGVQSTSTKFDLQMDILDFGNSMQVQFTYSTDLFKKESPQRMLQSFVQILETLCADPEVLLSNIEIASPENKQQILEVFNHTAHPFDQHKTLHELFEEQVEKTPDATAVVFEGKELTYRELNKKSNQLASRIRAIGIVQDDIVGIKIQRSPEMVIGLLAILKAGGAYMPIDPEVPVERLKYLIADSKTKVLLTDNPDPELDLHQINLPDPSVYSGNEENPKRVNVPENLAYVIYTSGSTGNPKGVMLEHKGVVNRIEWMKEHYAFNEGEIVLQKTTYTFDVSVWEFFMTLCYGAKLVLCKKEVISDVAALIDLIDQEKISTLHFVPSMFKAFLHGISKQNQDQLSSVKNIFTSGEALGAEYVRLHHQLLTSKLHNLYGPTEASVDVSYFETSAEDVVVPIGKPVWNTSLLILDPAGKLLPVGVPGELHIGGVQLARGYLNQPELTHEKFIQNPWDKNQRLYKTGDLARWNSDGNIEFLGRIDFQVKIRGFRIELGDIESQLLKMEGSEEVAVIDLNDSNGDKFLCAYMVSSQELDLKSIKAHLAKALPVYMIPSFFVRMDELPLNSSGKLNRKALPKPDESNVEKGEFVAPVSPMEKNLAEVWCKVLGMKKVGVHDNFFSIGGDSIKAIQLSAMLLSDKLKLDLGTLFQYPTIRELAVHIKKVTDQIDQKPVEGNVELTPIQARFFEREYPQFNHYNQSVMLESDMPVSETALRMALEHLKIHHDVLRIEFWDDTNGVNQFNCGVDSTDPVMVEVVDLTSTENPEEEMVRVSNQIQQSLDIFNQVVFKVGLFRTKDQDYVLLVAHHTIIDAVSWRILLEDLSLAYEQACAGKQIVLQEKTHSYQYWSDMLWNYSSGEKLTQEIPFWKQVEETKIAGLPCDKNFREANTPVKSGKTEGFRLSKEETTALLTNAHWAYQTEMNDLLLSGLGLAIKDWSGNDKMLINLEGHGREDVMEGIEISRTVGWFTSVFPVIVESKEDLFETIRTNSAFLHAIPNKGIGYGILRYLREEPFHAEPEIMFNYLGQVEQGLGAMEGTELDSTHRWQLSGKSTGTSVAPENEGEYLLDVNAIVTNGVMNVSIRYFTEAFEDQTIQRLTGLYEHYLKEIIAHCVSKQPSLSEQKEKADALKAIKALEQLITRPVFPLQDNGKTHNIFFFPPAISFSMVYQELASKIKEYNSYGINFLVDENRMDRYVEALVDINGDRPFVFAGYSGGANLAYQVAVEMEKRGYTVSDIIMLDGMREIEKSSMTREEIVAKSFEYIGEEENHPARSILKTREEREKVRKIVERYQQFLNETLDQEELQINLHQIRSVQQWEEGNRRKDLWNEIILGTIFEYQGFGEHGTMLSEEHLNNNLNLFLKAMDHIRAKTISH